ncbi:MAG TPA: rRNA maturation RNase YbeY [Bacteroidia bacterium]|nr:rRNA maturation RNase YbeY [Bacteroidia bacterium]
MINFFTEGVSNPVKNKTILKNWIKLVIGNEGKKPGDINIIFCDDEYLLSINKEYLEHDYYTDIITFNYNNEKVNGDLFISLDRVGDNAEKNNVPRETELHRVIIHGVLHLLGYNDKTKDEETVIREKEDACLGLIGQ